MVLFIIFNEGQMNTISDIIYNYIKLLQLNLLNRKLLLAFSLIVEVIAGTGCYRAAGIKQSPLIVEMLSENNDKVLSYSIGNNHKAKAGDYYLGNDFLHVAIAANDTKYRGSIIDASCVIASDDGHRQSMPNNAMGWLKPIVNSDDEIIFEKEFLISKTEDIASIVMNGRTNSGMRVKHTISLGRLDHFLKLKTEITNVGDNFVIDSIGDYLIQNSNKQRGYYLNFPNGNGFVVAGNTLKTKTLGIGFVDVGDSNVELAEQYINLWLEPSKSNKNKKLQINCMDNGNRNNCNEEDKHPYPGSNVLINQFFDHNTANLNVNSELAYTRDLYVLSNNEILVDSDL